MERVLNIVSKMNADGAETFLIRLMRNINKDKFMFDFLVFSPDKGFYDDEILSWGGRIHYAEMKSKNPIKSFYDIYQIVRKNEYRVVLRVSGHSLAALDLLAAAIGGAKLRMLRSSNSSVSGGISSRIIHMLFRPVLNLIVTQRLAPSDMAATWMFGKKHISNGSVKIINNGLEIDRFVFDVCKRQELREKMGLTDKFVVGHVGRISDQKNHKFLLDAFEAIKKENEAAVLLLVGRVAQPEIEISLKKRIENLGLNDSVIFTGVRSDIPDLLMAMDVFLFPSLYEGMPNAVIEAQATGLHCIISDTITKEVGFTDLVEYLPLNNPDEWAERALQYQNGYVHRNMRHEFIENGYDIESTIEWLEDYLTSHCDRLEMISSNK